VLIIGGAIFLAGLAMGVLGSIGARFKSDASEALDWRLGGICVGALFVVYGLTVIALGL